MFTRKNLRGRILPLCLLVFGCATVPMTGRKQLSMVPASELTQMSFDQYRQLIVESKLSQNTQQVAMVKRVGKNISTAAEHYLRQNGWEAQLQYYQWEFNLIQADSIVNAFCMPGGKVAVYTGILPVTRDEASLAVVVGHEVAHAVANHGGERMSQLLLEQLGGLGLELALKEKPQQTRDLALTAYGVGAQVGVLLPYSRLHESEADRIGLIFTAMAGYDPRVAIPFWQRMSRQGGGRPPEFLSTHPAPERRIQDLQALMPEALQYYRKQ